MSILLLIGYFSFLIAAYYGVTAWLGPETMANISEFLFGPYINLWHVHFADMMPGWTHPVILILVAAFLTAILPGFFRITRIIACFVISLFLVRLAFMITGAAGAPMVSIMLFVYAMLAVGWLFISSAFDELSPRLWLREKLGGER